MKTIFFSMIYLCVIFISSGCIRDIEVNDKKISTNNQETTTEVVTSTGSEVSENIIKLTESDIKVSEWIGDLDTPWSLVFLDDSRALVTERNGKVSLIVDGVKSSESYWTAPSNEYGEGGLMGIEKHPDYESNQLIYLMYTYIKGENIYKSKVVQIRDKGNTGELVKTIIDNIPASKYHNGGRIKFGPDKKLYITTGDAQDPDLSQNMNSLAGKILRVNDDGSIPSDNPFAESVIYTLGHRNPQGITWNAYGDGFLSTHGPSGEFFLTARDRIDTLVKGGNYGRPIVAGYSDDYIDPIAYYPESATPPSGMTFWNDSLFVATLKSEALLQLNVENTGEEWSVIDQSRWLEGKYGRLRDAVVGPDGNLYILTSNSDKNPKDEKGMDVILKIEKK